MLPRFVTATRPKMGYYSVTRNYGIIYSEKTEVEATSKNTLNPCLLQLQHDIALSEHNIYIYTP